MPPSGFSPNAIGGLLQFVRSCYLDLLAEVKSGKHTSFEEAIEFELRQLESALEKLHIDVRGNLVER